MRFSPSPALSNSREERGWKKEGRRKSYRFNFFTVGLPGSVPLQQFFNRGLDSDALIHPRLICLKRTPYHSCLLNSLFGADNSRHSHSPPYSTPPPPSPPAWTSLSPQWVFPLTIIKKHYKIIPLLTLRPQSTVSPWNKCFHISFISSVIKNTYCGKTHNTYIMLY